jgi:hypothetical protein
VWSIVTSRYPIHSDKFTNLAFGELPDACIGDILRFMRKWNWPYYSDGIQLGRSTNACRTPNIDDACKLFLVTSTVKRHINNIYAKLDVHSPVLRDGKGEGIE